MIESYKGKVNSEIALWILLMIVGSIFQGEPIYDIVRNSFYALSYLSFILACVHYAKGKGYSGWLGALGLASIPGLIVLVVLPDKTKDGTIANETDIPTETLATNPIPNETGAQPNPTSATRYSITKWILIILVVGFGGLFAYDRISWNLRGMGDRPGFSGAPDLSNVKFTIPQANNVVKPKLPSQPNNILPTLSTEEIKNKFPDYKIVGAFSGGFARANDGKGWFHIDTNGNPLYTERYEDVGNFSDGRARIKPINPEPSAFLSRERSVIIDKSGQVMPFSKKFDFISDYSDGRAFALENYKNGQVLIDTEGNIVIPTRFISAQLFKEGFAVVSDETGYYHIKKDGSPAYAERYGDAKDFDNGIALVYTSGKNQTKGYLQIDTLGRPTAQQSTSLQNIRSLNDFSEGLAFATEKDKDYFSLVDTQGNTIVSGKFMTARPFKEGFAVVSDETGYYHIKKDGNSAYAERYSDAKDFDNGIATVCDLSPAKNCFQIETNGKQLNQMPPTENKTEQPTTPTSEKNTTQVLSGGKIIEIPIPKEKEFSIYSSNESGKGELIPPYVVLYRFSIEAPISSVRISSIRYDVKTQGSVKIKNYYLANQLRPVIHPSEKTPLFNFEPPIECNSLQTIELRAHTSDALPGDSITTKLLEVLPEAGTTVISPKELLTEFTLEK